MARKLFFISLLLLLSYPPVFAIPSTASALETGQAALAARSQGEDSPMQKQVESVRIAREVGPGALRGLLGSLSGEARELALLELNEAERAASPEPIPVHPSAAPRVGVNGACTFNTIRDAIRYAPPRAVVRISAGIYPETIDLPNKTLTLEGGYNATCTAVGAGTTRIAGAAGAGSTIDILGGTVLLKNLEVSGGSSYGGGIDVLAGGATQVTLDNTAVLQNHGAAGGGVYVGLKTTLISTNGSRIADNSADFYGGGIAVYGTFISTATAAVITGNRAMNGGGLAVIGSPGQITLNSTQIFNNQAAGKGGGLYIADGVNISLQNAVSVGSPETGGNTAFDGGGVYVDKSTVHILSSGTVSNNLAANNGGGLYLASSALTVDHGSISGNSAGHSGGGIYVIGASVFKAQNGASIAHNAAPGGDGGGAALDGLVTADIQGAVLEYNTAGQNGGAVFADGSLLTASNGLFQNNIAAVNGGAIAAVNHASVTVQAVYPPAAGACIPTSGQCSSLHHNQAAAGGAIYTDSSTLAVLYTFLHHNSASIGGGAVFQTGASSGTYLNSLVYDNTTAQLLGAGLHLDGGTADITQVTAVDNTGGAGIWAGQGSYTVTNSILWGNSSAGSATSTAAASCSIDQFGSLGAVLDPQFIGSGDYHLKPTSPAIDACPSGPSRDLDNLPRPTGLRFDIGAYEVRIAQFLPIIIR